MTPTPTPPPTRQPDRGGNLELFTASLVGTLILAVAILVRVSWRRLRSKAVEPPGAPIIVE